MIERLPRAKRNVALAVLVALFAWFAWTVRSVVNPVLLGYLCAYILHPFVVAIEARGFARRTAVNLTFGIGVAVSLAVMLVLGFQVRALAVQVHEHATSEATAERLEPIRSAVHDAIGIDLDFESLSREAAAFFEAYQDYDAEKKADIQENVRAVAKEGLVPVARGIARFVARVFEFGGMVFLIPLYAYYFLFVQKQVNEFIAGLVPKRDRERITRVSGQIGEVIANFFRGRLGVSFLKGLLISLGLWIVGIDFAFLLGMLSGALSVIPFFGPFLGFVLAFVVGALTPEVGPDGVATFDLLGVLWKAGLVFVVAEMLEGYVLVPKVLGDSLGLHPLVVFVALLAGGAALGMLGVLIALPLTASCVILFREFALPALRDFADEDDDSDEPAPA